MMHPCGAYPCPICHPYVVPGSPPAGCVCPPTSEQTCQNEFCPRKSQQAKTLTWTYVPSSWPSTITVTSGTGEDKPS